MKFQMKHQGKNSPANSAKKVAKKTKGPSPIPKQAPDAFPMRINKYLAMKGHSTRRGADDLIAKKFVIINGRTALLGDKVQQNDVVEVRRNGRSKKGGKSGNSGGMSIGGTSGNNSGSVAGSLHSDTPAYVYYAFNKPPNISLETAARSLPLQDVFPVLSLDRDAEGLVILTNDRRIIDRLSNTGQSASASVSASHVAENAHLKEYLISTHNPLKHNFKEKLEKGVVLTGNKGSHPVTVDCSVHIIKDHLFTLRTTDNGSHIRHVCSLFMAEIESLARTRIGTIALGGITPGQYRPIIGEEKEIFLKELGL